VRQAHALTIGKLTANHDACNNVFGIDFGDGELDLAVVDQQCMAGLDRGEKFRMWQVSAGCIARRWISIKSEAVTVLHGDSATCECAETKFWALQIDEHTDRPPGVALHSADHADQLAHALVTGVAHVDA